MRTRKFIKVLLVFVLILAAIIGATAIQHPIILKWASGTARSVGRPVTATVYTDGKFNPDIKVYHVDEYWNGEKADYYLVRFPYSDPQDHAVVFSINKKEHYVGKPGSQNKTEYDIIFGMLFQGEVGARFTPFTHDLKGYNFDPQLTFAGKTIRLELPAGLRDYPCDSIRIEL